MSDLTLGLRIRVNDDGSVQVLNRTSSGIDRVSSSANNASSSISGLTSNIGKFAAATAVALAVDKITEDLFSVNREFQSLRTSLSTTVGGIDNARLAFSFIQDFAAKTPYDVAQVTESFILLGNMGLKPTEEALRSYGNTAAAQAKPIKQMIEAVADAATGEFERLKEFGIKAAANGDKVAFTFQGVSTTVGNTAAEIEQYLINLGNNKFGDAMAGQAATINGSISNLGDTWDSFMDHLLDDNKENLIAKWVKTAGDAIHWLDVGINGAITNADKLGVIDQRIAANRASLAAHKSNGMIGGLVDDLVGYDENLKKNQIAADIKAREALTKTITEQASAQDNLINSMGKSNAAAAGSATANKAAAEAGKKAASEAKKAATEAQNKADAIVKGIADELKSLDDQHQKLTLSARDYYASTLAAKGMTDAVKAKALAIWDANKALEAQKTADDKAKSSMDSLIDQYNRLTLSAREYFETTLKKQGLSPEAIAPQMQQFDKNTAVEAKQKSMEDAHTALKNYNASLDAAKTKTSDLGAITSAIFDGALGGINTAVGAFDKMVDALANVNDQLVKEAANRTAINAIVVDPQSKTYTEDAAKKDSLLKESAANELKLNADVLEAKLSGSRQIASAVSSMLKKGSTEQRAAHAIEMAIAGAEIAMQVIKITGIGAVAAAETASVAPSVAASTVKGEAKAAEAVSTQASAGPYIGFALMAAMAVAMAAIGFNTGSVSSVSVPPPTSPDTGTVLGDSTAKSESIDKTYELLKNIHAEEYAELRGINKGIQGLRNGITDTVTRLFQAGGLKDFATLAPSTNALTGNGSMGSPIHQAVVSLLFGGKQTQSVVQQGISTSATSIADIIAGANLAAQQFAVVETKTKGGLFTKTKTSYSTQYAELDSETQKALNSIFKSMGQTMMGQADILGKDLSSRINTYIIPALTIDLKGLNGEDAAKKLNGVISTALDTMSTSVFGDILGDYQKLGEGMFETAGRVAAEIVIVQDSLTKSGLELKSNVIGIADAIAQAAGGLEEFQKQFSSYFDKFYSDAEKQAELQLRLSTALDGSLAKTRDGYRAQIEALDLTNAKDVERYSLLIKEAAAADTYYTALENAAKAAADAMKKLDDNVTTARSNLSAAYDRESAALTATINKFDGFAKSLQKFRDALAVGDLSTGSPMDKYRDTGTQFNAVLATIKAGPGSTDASKAAYDQAQADFQGKASAFLSASRDVNASGMAYKADYQRVMAAINTGIVSADAGKTKAQQDLDTLKESVNWLIEINKSVLTVRDAVNLLNDSIEIQKASQAAQVANGNLGSATETYTNSNAHLIALQATRDKDQTALSSAKNTLSYYQGLSTTPKAGNPLWDAIMADFKAKHDATYGANKWSQDVINRATPGLQTDYTAQRSQGIANAQQSIDQLTPQAQASNQAVNDFMATVTADKSAMDAAKAVYESASALVNDLLSQPSSMENSATAAASTAAGSDTGTSSVKNATGSTTVKKSKATPVVSQIIQDIGLIPSSVVLSLKPATALNASVVSGLVKQLEPLSRPIELGFSQKSLGKKEIGAVAAMTAQVNSIPNVVELSFAQKTLGRKETSAITAMAAEVDSIPNVIELSFAQKTLGKKETSAIAAMAAQVDSIPNVVYLSFASPMGPFQSDPVANMKLQVNSIPNIVELSFAQKALGRREVGAIAAMSAQVSSIQNVVMLSFAPNSNPNNQVISHLIEQINSIPRTIPLTLTGAGIMGPSPLPTVKMPMFARGGISNQPSIFGEAGPEAAVPLPDGRSIPVTLNMPAGKSNAQNPRDAEIIDELKKSLDEQKKQTSALIETLIVMQSGYTELIDQNKSLEDALHDLGRQLRWNAA